MESRRPPRPQRGNGSTARRVARCRAVDGRGDPRLPQGARPLPLRRRALEVRGIGEAKLAELRPRCGPVSEGAVVVLALGAIGGAWASRPMPWIVVVVMVFAALGVPGQRSSAWRRPLASSLGSRAWRRARRADARCGHRSAGDARTVPRWRFGSLRTELASPTGVGSRRRPRATPRVRCRRCSRANGSSSMAVFGLWRRRVARFWRGATSGVRSPCRPPGWRGGGPVTPSRTSCGGRSSRARRRCRATARALHRARLGDDREQAPTRSTTSGCRPLICSLSRARTCLVWRWLHRCCAACRFGVESSSGLLCSDVRVLNSVEPSRPCSRNGGTRYGCGDGRPSGVVVAGPALRRRPWCSSTRCWPVLSASALVVRCAGSAVVSRGWKRGRAGATRRHACRAGRRRAGALAVFGGVPVASLPANLLPYPPRGGDGVGLAPAYPRIVGGPAAAALHLPTRVPARVDRRVRGVSASLPLPMLGPVLSSWRVLRPGSSWCDLSIRRTGGRRPSGCCVAVVTAALVLAIARRHSATGRRRTFRRGASLCATTRVPSPSSLPQRRRGRRARRPADLWGPRVDVLVLRFGGNSSARLAAAAATARGALVVAPPATTSAGRARRPDRARRPRRARSTCESNPKEAASRSSSFGPCASRSVPAGTT